MKLSGLTLAIDFIPSEKKNYKLVGNFFVQEISSIFEDGEFFGRTFSSCEKDGLTFSDHIILEKQYYIQSKCNIQPPAEKYGVFMSLWSDERQIGPIFTLDLSSLKIHRYRSSHPTCDFIWTYSCAKTASLQRLLESAVRALFFNVLQDRGFAIGKAFLEDVKSHPYASQIYRSLQEEMNNSDWIFFFQEGFEYPDFSFASVESPLEDIKELFDSVCAWLSDSTKDPLVSNFVSLIFASLLIRLVLQNKEEAQVITDQFLRRKNRVSPLHHKDDPLVVLALDLLAANNQKFVAALLGLGDRCPALKSLILTEFVASARIPVPVPSRAQLLEFLNWAVENNWINLIPNLLLRGRIKREDVEKFLDYLLKDHASLALELAVEYELPPRFLRKILSHSGQLDLSHVVNLAKRFKNTNLLKEVIKQFVEKEDYVGAHNFIMENKIEDSQKSLEIIAQGLIKKDQLDAAATLAKKYGLDKILKQIVDSYIKEELLTDAMEIAETKNFHQRIRKILRLKVKQVLDEPEFWKETYNSLLKHKLNDEIFDLAIFLYLSGVAEYMKEAISLWQKHELSNHKNFKLEDFNLLILDNLNVLLIYKGTKLDLSSSEPLIKYLIEQTSNDQKMSHMTTKENVLLLYRLDNPPNLSILGVFLPSVDIASLEPILQQVSTFLFTEDFKIEDIDSIMSISAVLIQRTLKKLQK
ncbi:MAG: hypothetical protein ACFFCZ_26285 [Promethearchaeota archaeon]